MMKLMMKLVSVRGQYVIVAVAEYAFPSGNREGQYALQFVVTGPVGQVHSAGEQSEAAGGVCGGATPGLHKRAGQRVHLIKAGIRKSLLCGERVSSQRGSDRAQAQRVGRVKKSVCFRFKGGLYYDNGHRRFRQRIGFRGYYW